jgi:hypothetical protein
MKKIGSFQKFNELIYQFLFSAAFPEMARLGKENFTRDRKLPLISLFLIILRNIKQSLQLEIDDYYELWNVAGVIPVSKQAFSKARTGLNYQVIVHLFTKILNKMCKIKDLDYYNDKYRLSAIDGANVALYNSAELKDKYGCSGGSAKAVSALASLAFDPLNNIILDGSLNPVGTDERICAEQHIQNIMKLPLKRGCKNLFIMDRGYPSRAFLAFLIGKKQKFLIRVRRKFNLEFDAAGRDEIVSFDWKNRKYRVRILKITLDSGEIETLVTNLDEKDLPYDKAAELYFKRWGIETKFNSLKNKLELENMSGRRVVTVQQDFWASLFLANMFASLEWETNAIIEETTADPGNKYKQTTNENRLISKARKVFIRMILETNPDKKKWMYSNLFEDIARRPVEVKPGRSSPRSTPRNAKFHDTYKSVT